MVLLLSSISIVTTGLNITPKKTSVQLVTWIYFWLLRAKLI